MKKTIVVIILSFLLSAFLGTGISSPVDVKKPYNVVLVTIDTLRADHLGCYGYPYGTSPFIDSISKKGILFKNAFSASSNTSPAHASLFTSLYPVQHKVLKNKQKLNSEVFTMADMFNEARYDTAGFVSANFLIGLKNGFKTFNVKFKGIRLSELRRGWIPYRDAKKTINSVLGWIKDKKTSDRFFLWVHLYDPHEWGRSAPGEYKRSIQSSIQPVDEYKRFLADVQKIPEDFYPKPGLMVKEISNYDAQILFADQQLKRLFDHMNEKGLNANTIWIITADHGEGLGNHDYKGHGKYLYNEQIHVPLIIYFGDDAFGGLKIDEMVRHVDILPTVADLTGISIKQRTRYAQGHSITGLISRSSGEFPAKYSFSQRRPKDYYSVRRRWKNKKVYCLENMRYKYIYRSNEEDEFFNLEEDPFELNNIIGARSEIKAEMKERTKRLYEKLSKESVIDKSENLSRRHARDLKALGYM